MKITFKSSLVTTQRNFSCWKTKKSFNVFLNKDSIIANRSQCGNLFHFCTPWRTTEYISTPVLACCLILKCFLVYYWRLRYPWKLSELSCLALSYCNLIRNIYAVLSSAASIFVYNITHLALSHLSRSKHTFVTHLICPLGSFRFLVVKFWKNIAKNDKIESAIDHKRMPAFSGIWCLIRFFDLKIRANLIRFCLAAYQN